MAKNRKAFIESVRKDIESICPGLGFSQVYADVLTKMSNAQFEAYIDRLRNGISEKPDLTRPRELLTLIVPNMGNKQISVEHNLALAKKWGLNLFERIWITDPITGETYLTNLPYAVLDMPICRQAQTLDAKISIAKHNRQVDERTNQATGDSKGASLSYPELQILLSSDLKATATELMKFRGGDETAFRIMNKQMQETGTFSQKSFENVDTRAKSTDTASIYLKAMHLDNQL